MSAVVIGGGLAGAAVALRLAQAGRPVVLIERETGPHDKVCGEFLSYEAVDSLRRLGLDPAALGAVPIDRLTVTVGRRAYASQLPFTGLSLSRRVLDEALLARAASAGVTVHRGVRATDLDRTAAGWTIRTTSGVWSAAEVFLATGKHDLRSHHRPPGVQHDLVGFKLHLRLAIPLERRVELHLFPGGYAGLEPIEHDRANLCLVVRKRALARAGTFQALLKAIKLASPHLRERLSGVGYESRKPLAIAAIPYGYVAKRSDGLWRIGDQAAVIPSFSGEGMAIALYSAELAAEFAIGGADADAFQQALARRLDAQVRHATWVSRMMVSPLGQAMASGGLAVAPSLAGFIAKRTRLRAVILPEPSLDA